MVYSAWVCLLVHHAGADLASRFRGGRFQ